MLERTLGKKLGAVKTVTMDMWEAYISAAKALMSEATLIRDRFPLIWYLNKAIDQVRRREAKNNEELKPELTCRFRLTGGNCAEKRGESWGRPVHKPP